MNSLFFLLFTNSYITKPYFIDAQHLFTFIMGESMISKSFEWREFACGWGAAFINVTVTYPVNKLIFRQVHFKLLLRIKV